MGLFGGFRGGLAKGALMLFVLCFCACAPSSLELVNRSRLYDAYQRSRSEDGATQRQVERALVSSEAPVVEVQELEGEALARLVGAYTARRLAPSWVPVRATVTSRARDLPYPFVHLSLGHDDREAPGFIMEPSSLIAFTGEALPKGYMQSDYDSPFSGNALLSLVFMPLMPITSRQVGSHYVPPTLAEIRLRAPRALPSCSWIAAK